MEIWVRSQDKERLMKTNGFNYIECDDDKHIINGYGICECDNYDLGIYTTKERALEVLDEIQEHLDYLNIGKINRVDDKGFRVSTIYEMPIE